MERVALITGAANGIGRATAHRFAQAGIVVIVADNDVEGARRVCSEIEHSGGRAEAAPLDVTRSAEVAELVREVEGRYGRIDILANIAGGSFYAKPVEALSWDEWKEVVAINLKGPFLFCRAVAPLMQRRREGRIINTASNYALTGSALRTPYSAAKAGIVAFTKSLAQEMAPYGVLVNAVAPGPTDTSRVLGRESPEARRRRWSGIPAGRTGKPEEIAEIFYFLATQESAWITGQTIHVNGGLVAP